MNQYHKLYTPADSAIVFIDHQPQMTFGVASGIDRQLLFNNVIMLARSAKLYGVPTILVERINVRNRRSLSDFKKLSISGR